MEIKKLIEDINRMNPENKEIKKVHLEIGELAEPNELEMQEIYDHMSFYKLKILKKKSRVRCKCGYEGNAKVEKADREIIFTCPNCGHVPEVLEGKDVKIVKLETFD